MKVELNRVDIGFDVYEILPVKKDDYLSCKVYSNISGELFDRYEKSLEEFKEIQMILHKEYCKYVDRMNDLS